MYLSFSDSNGGYIPGNVFNCGTTVYMWYNIVYMWYNIVYMHLLCVL